MPSDKRRAAFRKTFASPSMPRLFIYLFLLSYCLERATAIKKGDYFCTFAISGSYCQILRLLIYIFFSCGLFLGKVDWALGATFGTAMLFNSVASIHLILLAAYRDPRVWDPDVVPTFNLICMGLLSGSMLLLWSSSFRIASKATRITVIVWIFISLTGLGAGLRSYHTEMYSVTAFEACPKDIPMQYGQTQELGILGIRVSPLRIHDSWESYAVLLPVKVALALLCGITKKGPLELFDTLYHGRSLRRLWWFIARFLLVLLHTAVIILVIGKILRDENQGGWSSGEGMEAVGQWGRVVETVLAFAAAAVVPYYKERDAKKEMELMLQLQLG